MKSSRVQGSGRLLVTGILLVVGVLGGCGAQPQAAEPSASRSTPDASATQSPTPEPSITQTPESEHGSVDPGASVGDIVRYAGFANEVCSSEFYSSDDNGRGNENVEILDGGRAFLSCEGGHVLFDVFAGDVLWSRSADRGAQSLDEEFESSVESVSPGPDHVYVVITTNHPAVDLEAAYLTHEVEAYDAATGQLAWSAALEDFVPKLERSSISYAVYESAASTGYDIVMISGDSHSAFKASSGEPLWNTDEYAGEYLGLGISLNRQGSYGDDSWAALDVGRAKEIWRKGVPDVDGNEVFLEGTTTWQIGDRGVIALDLPTGRLALNRLYPETWDSGGRVVTTTYTLAYDGAELAMFRTEDLRKALWSTPSDPVTPLAVTRDLAIVQAESGLVVIDGRTGEVRDDVYLPEAASSSDWTVVDGLTLLDDGSILELSPPAGVAVDADAAQPESSAGSLTPPTT